MLNKTFTSGRIRRADYNPESQQLKGGSDDFHCGARYHKTLDDLFGPNA